MICDKDGQGAVEKERGEERNARERTGKERKRGLHVKGVSLFDRRELVGVGNTEIEGEKRGGDQNDY